MNSLTPDPNSEMLAMHFKLARMRLITSSYSVALLTEEQLVYVTEQMNRITEAILHPGEDAGRVGRTSFTGDSGRPTGDSSRTETRRAGQ